MAPMAKLATLLCATVLAAGVAGWRCSMARLSAGLRRLAQWLRERCPSSAELADDNYLGRLTTTILAG
jgi:hypothetical protein